MLSLLLAAAAGCARSTHTPATKSQLTVLELASTYGTWSGLDPLTNRAASVNHDLFNAIYGQLFLRDASGHITPGLASGYTVSDDDLTVDIALRAEVKFSDGTPFDATAVAFNIQRDLAHDAACICSQNFAAVSSVSTNGPADVLLHLTSPDPAIIDAFLDAAPNWIASPTAMGTLSAAEFALKPIGAGPFVVVSDQLSSTLVLQANPTYWRSGYPKVQRLMFRSVANDTTAYEALRANEAQIYMNLATPAILPQMKDQFTVLPIPATQTEAVNLNPRVLPFTSLAAREAIYYATDPNEINNFIFHGAGTVSQSPGGPGDLYWEGQVPGYRTFDLDKAKSLVSQLGGLSFTISTLNTPIQVPIVEALQKQWALAGIKATIDLITIPQAVKATQAGTLQAVATEVGSYNPSLMPGLAASYASTGLFSLVRDEQLDNLIASAAAEQTPTAAGASYHAVYTALNDKAYAPLLFTTNQWNVTTHAVHGIPNGTGEIAWDEVSIT
ncbi:ABC transporter substrate-binding protein [Jatrophihabitans telluris]|uniref:ABC transporter substrate-binding protein n=1 Tax=Jatrophihabitans telluris TaxID=2038343 RepID=A0ABY4QUJ3_9ACTN|nr:ABC transporter substrate-binding protein [Jatrophihabitans telluris]UQX87098.1 ABC transporter substrate-binding protein [Jatrophihabitans telluris]